MKKVMVSAVPLVMVSLACCFMCGCGMGRRTQIVGTLMDIRNNEAQKSALMAQETRAFERAKHFFLETKKAEGKTLSRGDCLRLFGEPSSEFADGWGYKPETSDWFKGERLFLFFDDKGIISRWEYQP